MYVKRLLGGETRNENIEQVSASQIIRRFILLNIYITKNKKGRWTNIKY